MLAVGIGLPSYPGEFFIGDNMKRNQSVSSLIIALNEYLDADRLYNLAYHGDTPGEIETFLHDCRDEKLMVLEHRISEVKQEFEI